MIDHLWEMRQALIENFQSSMKAIRRLMGYSVVELAEYIGVTRQTINNLENGRAKMSGVQFLSLAAVVDNYIATNEEMYQAIAVILDGSGEGAARRYDTSFSGFSLLRRWFLLFDGAEGELVFDGGGSLTSARLRRVLRGYKIFLDDTVFLAENAEFFFTGCADSIVEENTRLIVPLRSVEQLQEKILRPECSQFAVRSLRLLSWMQQKGLVDIRGEESDSNARDTILSVFLKFREMHRLCLITQDRQFAVEILELNNSKNARGFRVAAGYIDQAGQFSLYPALNQEDEDDILFLPAGDPGDVIPSSPEEDGSTPKETSELESAPENHGEKTEETAPENNDSDKGETLTLDALASWRKL